MLLSYKTLCLEAQQRLQEEGCVVHINHHPAQARVLAHFAAIFDLLAQSSIHKTALGDCSLVCDSSNGPMSFCSSALFIANFFCLGDPVLELACQIYVVKSSSNA